ncbi:MAG TPA: hypothetical protein VF008_26370 [Niastella sp.]
MKSKKPNLLKSISQAVLLYATAFLLIFSAACKKNMENQADDENAELNTSASIKSWPIENPGFNYYVTSSGGIAESSFYYYGSANTGYVTLSGTAVTSTQYYSVSLNQGSNSQYWNLPVNKTGSITAKINIGNATYTLGTIYVYAFSSGGTSITAMPPKVHLTNYYRVGSTLHLIFNWAAEPNSMYSTNRLFAALKTGEYASLNAIMNETSFQTFDAYVSDGTLHMQWPIPANLDSRYMQIAFTTDYLDLHKYFNEQHAFTNFNQSSDPFSVTGLQGTTPIFSNTYADFNVLKLINGNISVY